MSSEEVVPPVPPNPADEEKKLGNEAFVAKNYDLALKHYGNAIKIDPENAIYYANNSACYASKGMWKESMAEAEIAVNKDSKYMKAYYRLAVAQAELGQFDDSIQTLHNGLSKEPDNELLAKQLKTVRSKRSAHAAAAAKAAQPRRQLSEAQKKEIIDLQEQTQTYSRDLRGVQMKISNLQREQRMSQVTKQHIEGLPSECQLYKSVGKAFIAAKGHDDIKAQLEQESADNTKAIRDLLDRQEYLERRISSNTLNMREMTQGL